MLNFIGFFFVDDFKYHGRKYIRPIFALICSIMTFFSVITKLSYVVNFSIWKT